MSENEDQAWCKGFEAGKLQAELDAPMMNPESRHEHECRALLRRLEASFAQIQRGLDRMVTALDAKR